MVVAGVVVGHDRLVVERSPVAVAGPPSVSHSRHGLVDDRHGLLEDSQVLLRSWRQLQNVGRVWGGWVGLDGRRDDNTIGTWTTTADGPEDVRVLARVGSHQLAACKDNLSLKNLVRAHAKIVVGWGVAAALGPTTNAADSWVTAADDNHVILSGRLVQLAPDVAAGNLESGAGPWHALGAGWLRWGVGWLVGDALAKVLDPDLEGSTAGGAARQIVAGVADDEAETALAGKVDGFLDVGWGVGVDGVERDVAEGAGAWSLAGGVVDDRAAVANVVLQSNWVGADVGRVGQVGDQRGTLLEVLLWAWVAGDGWWLRLDELAAESGVELGPGGLGWPAVVGWTLKVRLGSRYIVIGSGGDIRICIQT